MGQGGGKFEINLTDSCNFGCSCDMNDVQPVCGANGLTYFSPCHAGCTSLLSRYPSLLLLLIRNSLLPTIPSQ